MKRFLKTIRVPAFLLGLLLVTALIMSFFTVSDTRGYQTFQGFYENEGLPLDAVYIGSSTTYSFWQAPFSWEKFGFTVYPLAFPSLSCRTMKYLVEEGRKTQPDALYILNLNTFSMTESGVPRIHYVSDYMPMSANRTAMIRELTGELDESQYTMMEFYLPFIRFHSGWNDLTFERVLLAPDHLKGGVHYYSFLQKITDVSDKYMQTDARAELTQSQSEILADLLQYCRDTDLNVLFLLVPQPNNDELILGQYNTIMDAVSAAGYPVLDLSKSLDELGLDMRYDFYNGDHVNIHGCVKYMNYFGAYLQEHYGFEDKRGDPAYASWDLAVEKYKEYIAPYSLDFEHGAFPRDYSLARPVLTGGADNGAGAAVLTWEPTANAEGFFIYRKEGQDGAWELLGQADAGAGSYEDGAAESGKTYVYTVVPVRYEDGAAVYGNYDYAGLGITMG